MITAADRAALVDHYEFVPTEESTTTWQERMVQKYHQHLYKEYVLADFTRKSELGLRWRTETEVKQGRGSMTCGNKHCPAQPSISMDPREEQAARDTLLQSTHRTAVVKDTLLKVPHGCLQRDFEVPFTYYERNEYKQELVKLRLCLRCSMLLFECRGEKDPAVAVSESWLAKKANDGKDSAADVLSEQNRGDEPSISSSSKMDQKHQSIHREESSRRKKQKRNDTR